MKYSCYFWSSSPVMGSRLTNKYIESRWSMVTYTKKKRCFTIKVTDGLVGRPMAKQVEWILDGNSVIFFHILSQFIYVIQFVKMIFFHKIVLIIFILILPFYRYQKLLPTHTYGRIAKQPFDENYFASYVYFGMYLVLLI